MNPKLQITVGYDCFIRSNLSYFDIIVDHYVYIAPSNVVNISKFFGINTVTVALELTRENDIMYSINIFPLATATAEVSGGSSIQLTLLYNVHYNVSVEGSQCGMSTTIILLHYGGIKNVTTVTTESDASINFSIHDIVV